MPKVPPTAEPEIPRRVTDLLLRWCTPFAQSGRSLFRGQLAALAEWAETDEKLAEHLGMRLDMPLSLLQNLLAKATETVRTRLLAVTPPEGQPAIQSVLASVSDKVLREAAAPRDFRHAMALIDRL